MNSVERVKAICKKRKIPIYKLEKDLGYANGYIGQLKKGTLPDNRLIGIANYLSVPVSELTGEKEKPDLNEEAERLNEYVMLFSQLSQAEQQREIEYLRERVKR